MAVGTNAGVLKIIAVDHVDIGSRPGRSRNHDLSAVVCYGDVECLRQVSQVLIQFRPKCLTIKSGVNACRRVDISIFACVFDFQERAVDGLKRARQLASQHRCNIACFRGRGPDRVVSKLPDCPADGTC